MKFKIFLLLCILTTSVITQANPSDNKTKVQIALLLDTSGSMNGLIEQAKAQLWNIANDITNYKKNRQDTYFQIALYEYGKSSIAASNGYIRKLVSFTSDMDHLSEVLFSLKTNGGDEYCGLVIHKSLQELQWNKHTDLKIIYLAGNESFAQGSFPFQKACQQAQVKEVIINTIFCGNRAAGINLQWNTGAVLGRGDYHNINHNNVIAHIASPYDTEINRLNSLLNKTYIYYGNNGKRLLQNMETQDLNANSYGTANYTKRSIYKSKSQYNNSTWDLVDAYKKDKSIIISADNLPLAYSTMSVKDLENTILEKLAERQRIQEEIACLAKDRNNFVEEKRAQQKQDGLGGSILSSLGRQMEEKGFVRKVNY